MKSLLLLASAAFTVAALSPSHLVPDLVPSDAANGQSHDVALGRDAYDRMTVPVSVGGSGPYRFLVDTGAERTVISRQLAEQLGLAAGDRTTMHSVAGSSNVATVNIPMLDVNARRLAISNAPALETGNIGADGMLGVDTLKLQRVLFDFKRGIMEVSPSSQPTYSSDGETVIVEAKRRHGRLLFTNATLDGHDVVVVVDTGSQISIGNLALRDKLLRRGAVSEPLVIETIAGERINAQAMMVQSLQMGGVTLKKLGIAFADSPVFGQLDLDRRPALLLGMNAFRSFNQVTIDFATRQVRFVVPTTGMLAGEQFAER